MIYGNLLLKAFIPKQTLCTIHLVVSIYGFYSTNLTAKPLFRDETTGASSVFINIILFNKLNSFKEHNRVLKYPSEVYVSNYFSDKNYS